MKQTGPLVRPPQPRRHGRPGLPSLHRALESAAESIALERGLRHRISVREQQLRLLRRHDRGGVGGGIDSEAKELRLLLLQNPRVLTAALETAQAIADTLSELVDVDRALMAVLSRPDPEYRCVRRRRQSRLHGAAVR
jgi:hypothetical protein